jgi:hypothetical protein
VEQDKCIASRSSATVRAPTGVPDFNGVHGHRIGTRDAALLADEMGTGKTIEVAGLVNLRGGEFRRVLLVTQARGPSPVPRSSLYLDKDSRIKDLSVRKYDSRFSSESAGAVQCAG